MHAIETLQTFIERFLPEGAPRKLTWFVLLWLAGLAATFALAGAIRLLFMIAG